MDLQPNRSDIAVLKTIKGHLGSCITNCMHLMPKVEDVQVPDHESFKGELDNCGEWTYKVALVLAYACREFEEMTNVVRVKRGKKPCDYTGSSAAMFLNEWQKLLEEEAPKHGLKFREDGKLVRS